MTTYTPRHVRGRGPRRFFGLNVCPICWTRYWRLATLQKHWYKEHDL